MKKLLLLWVFCLCGPEIVLGHDARYASHNLRSWKIDEAGKVLKASFYFSKNDQVYLEDASGKIHIIPLSGLSCSDRAFVKKREEEIRALQTRFRLEREGAETGNPILPAFLFLTGIFSLAVFFKKRDHGFAVLSVLFLAGGSVYLFSFKTKGIQSIQILSAQSIDSAFTPFKPKVYTRWDQNWFYVESKGIADHEMMTGITKWQQQVPIPQCYTGTNAWQIPLNPVVAANPIPVNNQHFLRGAIAIAVNGIPIFNPFTNTGVDAFLDGQLDNWGGHSGRADDYHYHIAPLHLYAQSNVALPIAFGLDGYPVYGSLEPDGSPMAALDEFHGHMGSNGVYHYHGTPAAPYMIGKMKGQVTEDATMQIIPQPSAHPVRPSGTPLTGATITGFTPNGTGNGYNMTYTKSAQNYAWNYSWTANNLFTFNYVTPTGTTTTNYNGQAPCTLPTSVNPSQSSSDQFLLFPNPASEKIGIRFQGEGKESGVISTAVFNAKGQKVFDFQGFRKEISVQALPAGPYRLRLEMKNGWLYSNFSVR